MLNTSMRSYKRLGIYHILKYARKQYINNTIRWKSCSCGNIYFTNQRNENRLFIRNTRVHSTQSDHHRQKVVIETSTPKIVIDKIKVEKSTNENTAETSLALFWREKIDPYIKLSRWDKRTGVYLLYWPCSWSIALASLPGNVPLSTTVETAALFLAGAGLMRGAGCTINDLWDRDIDAKVERTKDRPLVSGAISEKQAITFLGVQLTLGLGVLLQLNCYSVMLGASSMILVITYPLAKRFTNYPQIFLGATFNWGALLGYSAIQGYIEPAVCVPLYLSALAWTVVYDTIYAHQDKRDDARLGIKSTALTFGAHTKPALCGALAVSLGGMALAGHSAGLAAPYYAALAAYAAHAALQIYTLKPDNPDDCAKKFKSNSMVGLIILLGILGGGYQQYIDNRQKHRGNEDLSAARSCFFS
ncbi:4-hydroxybenzoate polyprenyltransferase, mitochondrial [Maniola jurtina]|uniref:4-hydroxybenzoate polyprenyltransferase, mitochondrial n=1 Tax=Maniola jurtina TaxID=191418 RepID=UPI001E68F032|nr:4-hydroxybenzoate polyprenyltransferase, mitochondrial [Maniola jurtina]